MSVELLAPVGNYEAFIGSINEGADAIYIGGSKFSARASCGIFSKEQMQYMIDYAHEYGVTVYIAFNTLIKQNELKEAYDYAIELYNMGVDALIVQDVGLINMLTKIKELEVHASTQLTIHNLEGALYFNNRGIKRVVVSRELSIEDIRVISEKVETEGFIHGAICVSYSGQCTMSALVGDRSGNRGRCAQPCRMEYSLINKEEKEFKYGFLMSPKDLMTINVLPRLLKETKIKSLKIEGRMKKGEYVVNAVKTYKDMINKIENDLNITKHDLQEKEANMMRVFNREGFTNAYMTGYEGEGFLAISNPKNQGIYIGTVLNDSTIILEENISLGDGVSSKNDGFILTKMMLNGEKIRKGEIGDRVKLFPTKYEKGERLFKTLDKDFENELRRSFEKEYRIKNYLNSRFTFIPNKPMILEVYSEDILVKVYGDMVEYAEKAPLSKDRIKEQLCKGSVGSFSISNCDFEYEEGYINISKINEIRRLALEKYRNQLVKKYHKDVKKAFEDIYVINKNKDKYDKEFYIYISTDKQFDAVYEKGFRNIIFSPFMYNRKINFEKLLSKKDINLYVRFPSIIKEGEFDKILTVFKKWENNIKGTMTSNAGVIERFKNSNYEFLGDHKLNIFNSMSVDFYNEFKWLNLSIELDNKELREIANNSNNRLCAFVYGKTDVMVSEYCPIGTFVGKRSKNNECSRPCIKEDFYLKDRVNNKLLLTTNINCKINTYKEEPINLIKEIGEIHGLNINYFRLDFIDESYDETIDILEGVLNGKTFKKSFKGNYYKPVE